jgi:hypothetical protein
LVNLPGNSIKSTSSFNIVPGKIIPGEFQKKTSSAKITLTKKRPGDQNQPRAGAVLPIPYLCHNKTRKRRRLSITPFYVELPKIDESESRAMRHKKCFGEARELKYGK